MAYDFYVRTKQDLIDAVLEYGVVPYFSTSVPGFSLEEHCAPGVLFSDSGDDTWAWKGPVIQETGCAYGKFFEKRAAYVSREIFLDLANYRRDGYDFDSRYDDGLARFQDKQLYDLIDAVAANHAMRVSTGVLNEIMTQAVAMQQPPADKGKRLRLYYITQAAVKPPTFVIFVNDKELMHFSYTRYIENQIRNAFGFRGTPLKFIIRERKDNQK